MTHVFENHSEMIKCEKDKKKGVCLTTRAMQHSKKCENASQCHSIAAENHA